MPRSTKRRSKSPRQLDREIAASLSRLERTRARLLSPGSSSRKMGTPSPQPRKRARITPRHLVLRGAFGVQPGFFVFGIAGHLPVVLLVDLVDAIPVGQVEQLRELIDVDLVARAGLRGNCLLRGMTYPVFPWDAAPVRARRTVSTRRSRPRRTTARTDKRRYDFKIVPSNSWDDAANKIRETINGVGTFHFNNLREFLSSGPYTARQAVLSHLGYIKRYPDVYGGSGARQLYDRAW